MRHRLRGLFLKVIWRSAADDEYSLRFRDFGQFKALFEEIVDELAIGSSQKFWLSVEDEDPLVVERDAALLERGVVLVASLLVLNAVSREYHRRIDILEIGTGEECLGRTRLSRQSNLDALARNRENEGAAFGTLAPGVEALEEALGNEWPRRSDRRTKSELHVLGAEIERGS